MIDFEFDLPAENEQRADVEREIGITKATISSINIKSKDKNGNQLTDNNKNPQKIVEITYLTEKGNKVKSNIFFSDEPAKTLAGKGQWIDCKGNFNFIPVETIDDLDEKLLKRSAESRKINEEDKDSILAGFRPMIKGEKEWISVIKAWVNYTKDLSTKKNLVKIKDGDKSILPNLSEIFNSDIEDFLEGGKLDALLKNEVTIAVLIKRLSDDKIYMEAYSEVEAGWKWDLKAASFDKETTEVLVKGEKKERLLNEENKADAVLIKKLTDGAAKANKNIQQVKTTFSKSVAYKVKKSKDAMIFIPDVSIDYFPECYQLENAVTNLGQDNDDEYAEEPANEEVATDDMPF